MNLTSTTIPVKCWLSRQLKGYSLVVISVIGLSSAVVSPGVQAEIYKWVDEDGVVHFSDIKPEDSPAVEIDLHINSYTSTSIQEGETDKGNTVTMYSTSWCTYCKKARNYFNRRGIQFTEWDIERNATAKREYDRLGGRGVPLIVVGKLQVHGFSEEKFEDAYQRAAGEW